MVCNRCKTVVKNELEELGIKISRVELGEVSTIEKISDEDFELLSERLVQHGFEILKDKDKKIIEKVKNIIVKLVYEDESNLSENLSDIIVKQLRQDYSMVSKLFSETEGITIEKYLINLRVERVKELLMYDELSLSQIAHKLNYSSTAYLSNQFKKVTGLSPSFFKKLKTTTRKPIDEI